MTTWTGISQKQLNGAKIYANRWDWVSSLSKGLDIVEVGVGSGDYSYHMMQEIKPNSLTLIDKYDQDDPELARPGKVRRYYGIDHYDFIKNKFNSYTNVRLIKNNSANALIKLIEDGEKFDMIYIDASHLYDDVAKDILYARQLIRDNGILAINDYVGYVNCDKYGVIKATNEFLEKFKDWNVIGMSLEENMMCDIYLSKYPW